MVLGALSKLGISLEQDAGRLAKRMGVKPIGWPPGAQPGSLIYRLPTDPSERASLFAREQRIRVSEGEVAVLLKDGALQGVLEPGTYRTEKARLVGDVDIVWMKTGPRIVRWGVGHVLSRDGIEVGANGTLTVGVRDAARFNAEVVQGGLAVSETDLQRLLMPGVQGVLRTMLARAEAIGLMTERERFIEEVETALGEPVTELGLGIRGFEVADFNLPPEFREAMASEALATARGRGQTAEARVEAEKRLLEAQTEAAAMIMKGEARAKVFAHLQAQGIDPMSLSAMDVLKAYAENPGEGLIGGDPAKAGLIGSVAAAAMNAQQAAARAAEAARAGQPVVEKLQLTDGDDDGDGADPPALESGGARGEVAASSGGGNGDEMASLQRQLDGLTERLANGELSEALYLKLADRLEQRIADLGGE